MAIRVLSSLVLLWTVTACGAKYDDVDYKDFRLTVLTQDAQILDVYSKLVESYNNDAGIHALTFVRDANEANSTITLIPGLQGKDAKIGWGQWIVETDEGSQLPRVTGGTIERDHHYSMRIEFDDAYVRSRLDLNDTTKRYELYKLFAHEVGHGFQQPHNPDPSDVMYYEVSGTKNFPAYFTRVREFFGK